VINRRWLLPLVVVGLLGVGCVGSIVALLLSSRAMVPFDELIPEDPSFPLDWSTGEMVASSVDWRISERVSRNAPDAPFGAASSDTRAWTDGGEASATPRISVEVLVYANPVTAWLQYSLFPPERAYRPDWPNFQYHLEDRFPAVWPYSGGFADQEDVACGLGGPESCQMWFYWARHGQYILSIEFFAPSRGASTELFALVVAEFDQYTGIRLLK